MADKIQIRRDNASNWSAVNPVLAQGEIGFDIDGLKAKIGNGLSSWNDLSYLVGLGASMAISAGSNSTDLGTVYFSNANGITFGMNTTGVITAAHNGLTVQTGNFASTDHVHTIYPLNSLFAGTNISGTVNETAFNLSVAPAPTIFAAHAGTAFSGTNISATVNSTALQLSVAAQTGNFLTTAASSNYALNSLFSGTNISGTLNSSAFNLSVAPAPTILGAHAGTAFSGTNISGTVNSTALQLSVAAQTGDFLTTAASSNYVLNSLFSGTNISGTINSSAFALSVAAQIASGNSTSFGYQSATPSQTTGATSLLANNGAWVTVVTTMGNYLSSDAGSAYAKNSLFAGTNISGTLNSSSFALSVEAPVVITGKAAASTFTGTNITGTVNSGGWSIQGAVGTGFSGTNISGTVNATGVALNVAAAPTILSVHAGTQFSGTNISGTVNSTALQLSVAAQVASGNSTSFGSQSATPSQTSGASSVLLNNGAWATVITTLGNYLTTAASSNYVINSFFAGTNISGTVNSSSFALSVAAPIASGNSTSFGSQSATPSQTSGASSVLANNGDWVTVRTTLGNYVSTNATTAYAQAVSVTGTNISITHNASGLSIGGAVGAGFSGTNVSGTVNATGIALSVAAAIVSGNSTSFGSQSATPTQVTGASSVLYNNGEWKTVAGGGVSNYTGVIAHGLSASNTNVATMGSIYYTGINLSINMTSSTNSSHIMQISGPIMNTGFVLAGNTSGSSSFAYTANEKATFAATGGLYISGTSNNAFTLGVNPVSNVEDPDMWWNMATTYSSAISTGSMFVRPFRIEWPVQFSVIDYPMSFALATTNSSCNFSLAHTIVIYSLNAGGTGLAPIVGNTGATVLTFTSGNNALSINGPRIISQTLVSTILTPGDYWVGMQHNWAITSGAATSSMSWGPMLISMPASTIFPAWSSSTTATGTIMAHRPWQGVAPLIATSSNTSGTTNVITIANMVVGSTQGYRANIPIRLKNITY